MANIAEKWKEIDGDLRLVRSKWEWSRDTNWSRKRSTWNPETKEYAVDDTASGLDTVFNSRLPVPFRVGSLDDPNEEHKKLLTLVVQPIADNIKKQMGDVDSEMYKTITRIGQLARAPMDEERERLDDMKNNLNRSHNFIFPDLQLDFDIGIGELKINPLQMLLENSKLKFTDWSDRVSWVQQGTGSQRALFWTMLQVRSRIKTLADIEEQTRKSKADLQKRLKKLKDEAEKAKKPETKQMKAQEIANIEEEIRVISSNKPEDLLTKQSQEFSLPGYMLLIDEPEIALHPNAIRSASRYLYRLSDDSAWQVMLATHSPLFIDPLHDHTTIVRLARSSANPTPRTYKSDSVTFSPDEKENLKMLNRFDQGLAEMFFGQFPILIEGDTEYAAFEFLMNSHPDLFPISRRPVLVRARGKSTMLLIMQILKEFRVPFAVLHDADTPLRSDGSTNGSWTINTSIYEAIKEIRNQGIRVVHRVSIPGFEYAHLPLKDSTDGKLIETNPKEKPWKAIKAIREDEKTADSVLFVLKELLSPDSEQSPYGDNFEEKLLEDVQKWAQEYCPKEPKFSLK